MSASDFRLYQSSALDVLAELLADALRKPVEGQSLLQPELILIPQPALRRWLQAILAARFGIAANLEFLTPGEFVSRALVANLGAAVDVLEPPAMQWALHAALQDHAVLARPGMAQMAAYLADADAGKSWALAGELARIFEKYQAWRGDWLQDWDRGAQPDDAQAILWRAATRGRGHRARRVAEYLRRFGDSDGDLPAGLPKRLFVFATLNVSPDVLRVITTQARVGTLHFYLPSPTREYWGDLQSLRGQLRDGVDPAAIAGDNPLLRDWGAAGRDFMALLCGYSIIQPRVEVEAWPDPLNGDGVLRDSLLHRMQSDLLWRRGTGVEPDARCASRTRVDRHDPSLQFHACHTRLRELQVLHDQLRSLLDDARFDPPLQPREIAVLAPDIDPYLPYLAAVFGGAGQPLNYSVADASPRASEPLVALFLRLLELPTARFGLEETLDLLASPVLAEPNGLQAETLDRLRLWLHAAGARWGLDADHRAHQGAPRDVHFTWEFALDRLLLGYAVGTEEALDDVAPWPVLEGSALDALDALLQVLSVLRRFAQDGRRDLSPAQWGAQLNRLLNELVPERRAAESTRAALEQLRKAIAEFARQAACADYAAPVSLQLVRAHFTEALTQASPRAPLLGGGVSFARMVPMRQLPFRVICLLGMNDGDFPRQDPHAGLNRLLAERTTAQRRYGDRSTRDDDRFLFLQLFSAAQEVFYLSWLGADPHDGSAREPALVVSELLRHAGDQHAQPEEASKALVVHHALQPFSVSAFGTEDEPRRFSYRKDWQAAATALCGPRAPLAPWLEADVAPGAPKGGTASEDEELSLHTLQRFFKAPAEWFLENHLAMRLPQIEASADDVEPLQLPNDNRERHTLRRAVFDALLDGTAESALRADLGARGLLASGALGWQVLRDLIEQLAPYAEALGVWRENARQDNVRVGFGLDGLSLHGEIADVYPHGLARLRFGNPNGSSVLRAGLDWLFLAAADVPLPLVEFHQGQHGRVAIRQQEALDPEQARAALCELLALFHQGQQQPLLFVPHSGWKLFEADDASKGLKAALAQWQGNGHGGWAEGDSAALRLVLRGRDLFAQRALLAEFARLAGVVFGIATAGAPVPVSIEAAVLPECDDAEDPG